MAVAAGVLLLGGCASFSPDGGLAKVDALAKERAGLSVQPIKTEQDAARVTDEVSRLLVHPLDADTAVKIALLNNRGLQASLADLGIAEADLVQAGRLRNPGFTFGRSSQGDEREFERSFLFDIMSLLTLPKRTEIERRRFEQTQLRLANEVLRLAADTRKTFFSAVAAQETVNYMRQAKEAAEAGAELTARMAKAGSASQLRHQREQAFHAEVVAQLARAQQAAASERERLTRLLGLGGGQAAFRLPARLPDLPATPLESAKLEQQAMDARLDMQMARREVEALADNLGLTRATRFVNVLELGYLNASSNEAPAKRGYEIELRLPIFDWGDARVAKAEAVYTQALHRAAEQAVNARSEVREAYIGYRAAYDLARHYRDEIVPLRKKISEENLLRYNGMLINVFELLADAREQVASVNAYFQSLRDFWLAESALQLSLNGSGAGGMQMPAGTGMPAAGSGGGH
ncbi:MAG: TolC family protein [Betaproteobacteria bacterium]|nr:TolC family protein [Betaproteobacteria bacterium]